MLESNYQTHSGKPCPNKRFPKTEREDKRYEEKIKSGTPRRVGTGNVTGNRLFAWRNDGEVCDGENRNG